MLLIVASVACEDEAFVRWDLSWPEVGPCMKEEDMCLV